MKPVRFLQVFIVLVLVASCGHPRPPLPPPDGPGDCTTALANLRAYYSAAELDAFEEGCREEETKEAEKGVRLPVGCLTAAKSREEALRCK